MDIIGTDAAETLDGTAEADLIDGGAGNDVLNEFSGGADILRGGAGDDQIYVMRADPGMPYGPVVIDAGSGNDFVRFWSGRPDAVIDLGTGDDRLRLDDVSGRADITITLGGGRDVVSLHRNADTQANTIITDFTPGVGGDVINMKPYLEAIGSGYTADNPVGGSGFLSLVASGTDTLLSARGVTLFTLRDTAPDQFVAANFIDTGSDTGQPGGAAGPAQVSLVVPESLREGDTASQRLSLTFKGLADVVSTITMSVLADESDAIPGVDAMLVGADDLLGVERRFAHDVAIDLGAISVLDDRLMEADETIAIRITATGQTFDNGTDTTVVRIKIVSDDIVGSDAADLLVGTALNDELYGKGGNDDLYGNEGNDRLHGGRGNDMLAGGAGDDIFYFDTLARGEKDLIRGFGEADRLYSETALTDNDQDGVIRFGRDKMLDIGGGDVRIYGENGKTVTALHLVGEVTEGSAHYYVYALDGH